MGGWVIGSMVRAPPRTPQPSARRRLDSTRTTVDAPTILLAIIAAVAGYASGSIPVGVLVARAMGGPDPRTIGSGRTGTTNALRALGPRGALLVIAGDLLKGAAPVVLARVIGGGNATVEAVAAIAAVIGSARSVFLGFGGGRGLVTLAGTMVVLQPIALALAAPVFVGGLSISRYMSVGSLLGSAALLPATAALAAMTAIVPLAHLVFAAIGPAIVWVAHADNIERLRHGTERRFDFKMLVGKSDRG
jgi:acyl phosphate:glycerol-3-phosphate acyltransferase